MDLLIIGGSSFIGRNLIDKAPEEWKIRASYCTSQDFPHFASSYLNVEPFMLDLRQDNYTGPGRADVVLYLPTMTPGQATGDPVVDSEMMYLLHSKGVNKVVNALEACELFIYFSSGIFYLRNDYSDYRKSKLLGEANVLSYAMENKFKYLILRNMETYGPHLARHKIYRRIAEACLDGEKNFQVAGDGSNLLDTMYIDDYVAILIKAIETGIANEILPMCRSKPVTLKKFSRIVSEVYRNPDFSLSYGGKPTEETKFVLDNQKMIKLTGIKPQTTLKEGLKKWKERAMV